MNADARLLFGTGEPVTSSLPLQAGALVWRLRGTRLLPMYAGGHEVWHGLAFLFRDTGWGTPDPVVDDMAHESTRDGFRVDVRAHIATQPRIDLRISITGRHSGQLRYEAVATPQGDLEGNRIGLCLTHPQSLMGRRIEVEHVDGRRSASTFPWLVAAWPPFTLVRAIRHEYAPDAWASCRFEGDVFEFEDQRNNADASFKTYSRSNLMPRPLLLRAGVPIRQAVELHIERPGPTSAVQADAPLRVTVGERLGNLPSVGVAIEAGDSQASPALRAALRELAPSHLHLCLAGPDAPVDWAGIGRLMADAGATLRLDLQGVPDAQAPAALSAMAVAMDAAGLRPEALALFPGSPAVLEAARAVFPGSAIGSGTPYFFAQINRIEGLGQVDFLSFTTSSIVHAADDDTVMHGLQSLPWLLRTLHANHPGVPVRVGPSSIAARHSPLGPQPLSDGTRRLPLARRDPRSRALFAAAWALGHVAGLAYAGARAVTVMSLRGGDGIVDDQAAGPLRHPVYGLLQRLGRPAALLAVQVSDPARLAVLALRRDGRSELLLANLTAEPLTVELDGRHGGPRTHTLAPYAWKALGS